GPKVAVGPDLAQVLDTGLIRGRGPPRRSVGRLQDRPGPAPAPGRARQEREPARSPPPSPSPPALLVHACHPSERAPQPDLEKLRRRVRALAIEKRVADRTVDRGLPAVPGEPEDLVEPLRIAAEGAALVAVLQPQVELKRRADPLRPPAHEPVELH